MPNQVYCRIRCKPRTVESQILKFVLAPALIGFARFRKQLANGTIKVRSLDMPIFLWENNDYDPDDLTAGMFRNTVLVMVCSNTTYDIFWLCLFRSLNISLRPPHQPFKTNPSKQRRKARKRRGIRWPPSQLVQSHIHAFRWVLAATPIW